MRRSALASAEAAEPPNGRTSRLAVAQSSQLAANRLTWTRNRLTYAVRHRSVNKADATFVLSTAYEGKEYGLKSALFAVNSSGIFQLFCFDQELRFEYGATSFDSNHLSTVRNLRINASTGLQRTARIFQRLRQASALKMETPTSQTTTDTCSWLIVRSLPCTSSTCRLSPPKWQFLTPHLLFLRPNGVGRYPHHSRNARYLAKGVRLY